MSNQRIEKRIYDSYSDFSKEYIKSMELKISTEKFGELRKHFISILFEDLGHIFNTPYKCELVINIMQIAFKAWNKMELEDEELKNSSFIYFLMASCFLALKLNSNEDIKTFKYWLVEKDFKLDLIYYIETRILIECNFRLYIETPNDVLNAIFKNFEHFEKINCFRENILNWIHFALSIYEVFSKYDYFTITLSCCLLCFSSIVPDEVTQEEADEINQACITYAKGQKIVDKSVINNCEKDILFFLEEKEESEAEEFIETALTKANSTSLLNALSSINEKGFPSEEDLSEGLKGEANLMKELYEEADEEYLIENSFLSKKRTFE